MSTLPPLLDGMAASLKAMAEHQRVISENIANSETPGYKARTVTAPDFSSLVAQYGEATGTPHVARPRIELSAAMTALGARPPQGGGGIVLDSDTSETKPDGNNVTLEDQLLTLGQVQADYTAMTNIYKKQMNLMKLAIGR
ncbi:MULTISPECIES: flagellar basal body rod protein FlgB [Sphingomonadaceae]|uniref:Flagellar basal body rod protein FlgB n=1 Tax=Novosphingobium clariflavum TaxID=2029884 RepID=A0ABV6SB98_9SPHN|nr:MULTISPECIES: flagellar basal body protein [Sphingomonadaceae]QDK31400.1 flagellar biosynthesis protein FlgB [Sphingomonas sp. IC081]QSR16285.1 flagellar biosynthesis protein FlgB [Novosphingobium sp. KA1]